MLVRLNKCGQWAPNRRFTGTYDSVSASLVGRDTTHLLSLFQTIFSRMPWGKQ